MWRSCFLAGLTAAAAAVPAMAGFEGTWIVVENHGPAIVAEMKQNGTEITGTLGPTFLSVGKVSPDGRGVEFTFSENGVKLDFMCTFVMLNSSETYFEGVCKSKLIAPWTTLFVLTGIKRPAPQQQVPGSDAQSDRPADPRSPGDGEGWVPE